MATAAALGLVLRIDRSLHRSLTRSQQPVSGPVAQAWT